MGQLFHDTSKSKESHSALKAKLTDLAHSFCGTLTPIDMTNFTMHREGFQAIKSLRNNSDIVITKANKSNAVVILNKSDYLIKINVILDSQKFQKIGPVDEKNNTARIKGNIQRRILALTKENMLAKSVYEHIRPSGSQRLKSYGHPKTHKKDVLLRPILSMVGSALHELAKFFSATLQPVLDLHSRNCTKDSFSFAQKVQQFEFNPDISFLWFYDISSLFTNVPSAKTLQICADTLYYGQLPPPQFSK